MKLLNEFNKDLHDRWGWLRAFFSLVMGMWLAGHRGKPAVSLTAFFLGLLVLVTIHLVWFIAWVFFEIIKFSIWRLKKSKEKT